MNSVASTWAVCLAAAGTIAFAVALTLMGVEPLGFLLFFAMLVRLVVQIFKTLEVDDSRGVVLIVCTLFTVPAAFFGSLALVDLGIGAVAGAGVILIFLAVCAQIVHALFGDSDFNEED